MAFKIPLFKVAMPPWAELGPALEKTLYSGYIAEGAQVADFEKALHKFFRTAHLFTTSSCTSALTIALRCLNVGKDDVVVVTPMTCLATAAAVLATGAKIAWADVDPRTGLASADGIGRHHALQPKAVVVVDWAGDVAVTPAVLKTCAAMKVPIVEDAAQAIGTSLTGADFRCFSFQAIKQLTTGDGGCAVARTAELAARGKRLSWFGIDRQGFRLPSGEINWACDVSEVGYKANMNNIAATLGLAQMPRLEANLKAHRANAERYRARLSEVREVVFPPVAESARWVLSLLAERRDELMGHLQASGIQASRMHVRQDAYSGIKAVGDDRVPGVDWFAQHNLCLPCGWWMSEQDVDEVSEQIGAFYGGKPNVVSEPVAEAARETEHQRAHPDDGQSVAPVDDDGKRVQKRRRPGRPRTARVQQ